MIGLRRALRVLKVDLATFSTWVDQGIKVSGEGPELDLPFGAICSEIELILSNFAKGPVSLAHMKQEVFHSLVIAVSAMQALKGLANGSIAALDVGVVGKGVLGKMEEQEKMKGPVFCSAHDAGMMEGVVLPNQEARIKQTLHEFEQREKALYERLEDNVKSSPKGVPKF